MTNDDRWMEITWKTTPSELRVIAGHLERDGCRHVIVNWYHTRLIFVFDDPEVSEEPFVEFEGDIDGSIPLG